MATVNIKGALGKLDALANMKLGEELKRAVETPGGLEDSLVRNTPVDRGTMGSVRTEVASNAPGHRVVATSCTDQERRPSKQIGVAKESDPVGKAVRDESAINRTKQRFEREVKRSFGKDQRRSSR